MKETFKNLLINLGYSLIKTGFKPPIMQAEMVKGFCKRICLKNLLDKSKINCVLDVGANDGGFAKMLREIGYRGYIISFEPNFDEFSRLSNNFKKDSFWKGYNLALGSENTTATFNIHSCSVLSSFLQPKSDTPDIKTCKVEIKRLDSIFDNLLSLIPEPRIFLKADTQGYDIEVVKGASKCIDHILGLLSEVSVQPIYDSMPHYLESLQFYESLGFKIVDLFSVTRDLEGKVIEYDSLMVRSLDHQIT